MAFSKICDRPVRGKIHRDDARDEEQRFPGGTGRHRGDPQGATFSLWKITHRIHGAGIYMLTFGVHMGILMVNVTIYSSTMDPIEDFPGFSPQKTWKNCT